MTSTPSGNHVILINAAASPSTYAASRFADKGPDGKLNWDKLDHAGIYFGHLEDQLVGTQNASSVANATGAKVYAESFGLEAGNLPITSLDGSNKTIVEAARDAGKVTALIQSGAIYEPGTAAFVAKTSEIIEANGSRTVPRAQAAEIARQVIESGVDFIFAGGELNLLPVGTNGFHGTAAQLDSISTNSRQRPTENLITLAQSLGYTVVYTKQQLTALLDLPVKPTKVLGVFAPVHTFNDRPEEILAATGLPAYRDTAPTIAEMLDITQQLMENHPNFVNGSIVVANEEGVDNFGNNNNAVGVLEAVRRADAAIGVALDFVNRHSNTLMITAGHVDPGGLQVIDPRAGATVGTVNNNPTTTNRNVPLDGQTGANTTPFVAAPDANGNVFNFGIAWAGTPDFAGSIIAKAHGLNAANLPTTLDNTQIYEMMHEALFGQDLVSRNPGLTPAPSATKPTGNVIYILPDGASPSHYMAARNADLGPDGRLNWDKLTAAAVVSNHAANQLTGSPSSGSLAHATGVKAFAESLGLNQDQSRITSASGKVGITVLEEAIAAQKATALIQSGRITDPGTAAFVAEITNRDGDDVRAIDKHAQIAEQIIRSGTQIIMGGGEINFLPIGTIGYHVNDAIDAQYSNPNDRPSINLIELAASLGYTIVYTKDQLNAAVASATANTKLLGIFSADRTFDARTEEFLGLNSPSPQPLYSNTAPTVSEMLAASLEIVKQNSNGFFVVAEENGVRRFGEINNAVGTVEAVRRTDAAIGVAMDYVNNQDPNTLVITAPTGDAGGLQVFQYLPYTRPSGNSTSNPILADVEPSAPFIRVNPTTTNTNQARLDGVNGSTGTSEAPWRPFSSQESLDGPMGNFGIGWVGTGTFVGSTVAKAYGMNADQLPSTIDNTEIYTLIRQTLFLFRSLSVASVGTANTDGVYDIGSQISIVLRLPEKVFLDITADTPTLTLETGEIDRTAVYQFGSGTNTLIFAYTVQAGDSSSDLDIASTTALQLNGATIRDAAGNNVVLTLPAPGAEGSLAASADLVIDGVAPAATGVGTTTANGSYNTGTVITLTVPFSEAVFVNTSGGAPTLLLETGVTDRVATYVSGSGTNTLSFSYTVQAGDSSTNLDIASTTALQLNGATIRDAVGNNAVLTLPAPGAEGSLAANAALVIDGVTDIQDNVGLIQGSIANGGFSNDSTPTLRLTLASSLPAGSTLRIFLNEAYVGNAIGSGTNWSYTSFPLVSGAYTFKAGIFNSEGVASFFSEARSVIIDLSAPTQTVSISSVTDDSDPVQGTVAFGGRTNDTTPTISGTLSAALGDGDTLKLYNGSTFLMDAVVDNSTLMWSASPSLSTDGTYSIRARVQDAAGNQGPVSARRNFILDTLAPVQTVTITAINDNMGAIQGDVADGGVTNDTTPTLSGTLSAALGPAEVVKIYRDGAEAGNASVNSTNLTWTYTPRPALSTNGTFAFTAAVVDGAGNVGPLSASRSMVLDAPISTDQKDTLTGTTGTDIFLLPQLSWSLLGEANDPTYDTIIGFQSRDRIQLSGITFKTRLTSSAGNASSLTEDNIDTVLTPSWGANTARAFTVTGFQGTFVALNDAQTGYQAETDAILFLSGYDVSSANGIGLL